jgi:hypothetical protein
MKHPNLVIACLVLIVVSKLAAAQSAPNPNCTLIVPNYPLTAAGLATPYQLLATDPNAGACHETNVDQSAFVQAAVVDPGTGQISIYNPLVIDQGTTPAAPPVVPTLPPNAVVALWFGSNGSDLTLQAAPGVLQASNCVNGLPGSDFGQFAYCNAPDFFRAANKAIRLGQLPVPALGTATDGQACPTVRSFFVVDQDQSDNLPTSYLVTSNGIAQNTKANLAAFPGATVLGNPSDNGLVDKVLDVAMGCTPWKVADLADPGQTVAGLALNEIQARSYQATPIAMVPIGDPMALNNGQGDLDKLNAYRRGAGQWVVTSASQADTARYCRQMLRAAPDRILLNQALFTATGSPLPDVANSLFTFLAQRFVGSFDTLDCGNLTHRPDPVSVTFDVNGVAISATITPGSKTALAITQAQDNEADSAGVTK